jgi:arylsulfatase A-like enzyme
MFVLYDPQQPGGGRELDGATIYDIVPTLLALFDVRPGPHARGQVLTTRAL